MHDECPWGLTKRLVLEKAKLARLLRAYEKATGKVTMQLAPRLKPGLKRHL